MKSESNLPPGVTENMIPGNRLEDKEFEFTDREKQRVMEDPRIVGLVIDYHESQMTLADAMGFEYGYHERRISLLREYQKTLDL